MSNKEINYALVEEKRPPIYTAMKYWGKKPHNIWSEYIKCYTPSNGIFLDPFCGSAMSAFETVNLGRKAYALDLNPLSSFMIEVLSSEFDEAKFLKEAQNIVDAIDNDKKYTNEYKIKCNKCGCDATIINFKWDSGYIYEVAVECIKCKSRYTIDVNKNTKMYNEKINSISYWYPNWEFPNSDSFGNAFLQNIGGNKFSNLWTTRNLYILAKIFNLVENIEDENIKRQLLFGFIQTIHLCSKMCVPRRKEANRDFSTSWGRSAYICAKRQMEMNPLHLFKNSCIGKQSVQSALKSANKYMKIKPVIQDITANKQINKEANLYYGIVDIKNLNKFIESKSVDFILTDPPYGGLVKYFDLSSIWLSWLYKIDKKYMPDYSNEITVNNGNIDLFYKDFVKGLKNLREVLKDDGKIVFTFNNQDEKIWNVFLNSITSAGFRIEKVIHQQNKRTGESNVASKFGMSSSDFYIRCVKAEAIKQNKKLNQEEYDNFIIETTAEIIKQRNEPTNYDILFAGLLGQLSSSNFDIQNCNAKIENILKQHIDKEFVITKENGNKWFLNNYKIKGKTLTEKVKETIYRYVEQNPNISKDIILGKIFKDFPNGMTPDPVAVEKILNECFKGERND